MNPDSKNLRPPDPVVRNLRIAGSVLRINPGDPDLPLDLEEVYEKFAVPPAPPEWVLETRWSDLSTFPMPKKALFSTDTWQLYLDAGGRRLFTFTSPVFGPTPYRADRKSVV